MSAENDNVHHLFTGEPQPIPELDIPTIHEVRIRIAGLIAGMQAEILQPHQYESIDPSSLSLDELVEAVAKTEAFIEHEQPQISRERKIARDVLWQVMGIIDDMENQAIKTDL